MGGTQFSLPAGKRIAVIVSVLLETWSDNKYPSYFPRTSPLGQGKIDYAAIDWSQFGGRDGIWRLNRILSQEQIRGTLFCNARSAELFAPAVKRWIASGHSIAGHAYLQNELLADMSLEDERTTIRKSLSVPRDVSGAKVQGWVTPIYGWTQNTIGFLAEEGLAWTSDGMHASMPRLRGSGAVARRHR